MNLPRFLHQQTDGSILLAVKVHPRASRNEICEVIGNELKIKIAAPPVDSAANDALILFLAERLDCPRSAVRMVRGGKSKHKTISVTGLDAERIAARLTCDSC